MGHVGHLPLSLGHQWVTGTPPFVTGTPMGHAGHLPCHWDTNGSWVTVRLLTVTWYWLTSPLDPSYSFSLSIGTAEYSIRSCDH